MDIKCSCHIQGTICKYIVDDIQTYYHYIMLFLDHFPIPQLSKTYLITQKQKMSTPKDSVLPSIFSEAILALGEECTSANAINLTRLTLQFLVPFATKTCTFLIDPMYNHAEIKASEQPINFQVSPRNPKREYSKKRQTELYHLNLLLLSGKLFQTHPLVEITAAAHHISVHWRLPTLQRAEQA